MKHKFHSSQCLSFSSPLQDLKNTLLAEEILKRLWAITRETVEQLLPRWPLSPSSRGALGLPCPAGPGAALLPLPSAGQEGRRCAGCCGSTAPRAAPRKGNRVGFEAGTRECQQGASGCSTPPSLAGGSFGQRFVPSWGVEGTSIAPHAMGI